VEFENGVRALLDLCMFAENSLYQVCVVGVGGWGECEFVRVCLRSHATCLHGGMHVFVRVFVCVCSCTCMMHVCIHTRTQTHTCIHAHMYTHTLTKSIYMCKNAVGAMQSQRKVEKNIFNFTREAFQYCAFTHTHTHTHTHTSQEEVSLVGTKGKLEAFGSKHGQKKENAGLANYRLALRPQCSTWCPTRCQSLLLVVFLFLFFQ